MAFCFVGIVCILLEVAGSEGGGGVRVLVQTATTAARRRLVFGLSLVFGQRISVQLSYNRAGSKDMYGT